MPGACPDLADLRQFNVCEDKAMTIGEFYKVANRALCKTLNQQGCACWVGDERNDKIFEVR